MFINKIVDDQFRKVEIQSFNSSKYKHAYHQNWLKVYFVIILYSILIFYEFIFIYFTIHFYTLNFFQLLFLIINKIIQKVIIKLKTLL